MARRISSSILVGREAELDVLADGVARAASGSPSVLLVTGDAGIGKSRLIVELAHRAADGGALVLRGACVDLAGPDLPYAPIVGALRDVPADLAAAAAGSLPALVQCEIGRLVPALAVAETSLDPVATPGADARMHEHLLALLRALARSDPVVLVVEDAHWADQATRDFLLFLARNVREERLAVVVSHRPDIGAAHGDSRPPEALRAFLGALRLCPTVEALELQPLSHAETAAQIEAILGDAPDAAVVERLCSRAQGNPFYIEELLAMPADRSGKLPAALQSALLTRVEALPEEAGELLTMLSAFGRPIGAEVLGAAVEMDERTLSRWLRTAADAYLIAECAPDELGFRHALTREAVYANLLGSERRRLHRSAAQALEATRDRADPAELALHWLQAGVVDKALTASLAAGAAAMDVYAFGLASQHYETAVGLWPRSQIDGLTDILARAAEAAACAGDLERALGYCRQGLETGGPDATPETVAWFYERLGRYQVWDVDTSLACYGEALRRLPDAPSAARARVLADQGLAEMLLVRWETARERCTAALDAARAVGAAAEEGYARAILGLVLAYLGDFDAAEEHLQAARALAVEQGRPEDLARVFVHHGEALRLKGDVSGALELMREGEAMAGRLGVEGSYGRFIAVNAAADLFDIGSWEACERRLSALEDAPLVRSEQLLFDAVAGRLAGARGRLDDARARLAHWLSEEPHGEPTELVAYAGAVSAEIAAFGGTPEDARRAVETTLERIGERRDRLYTPWVLAAGVRAEAEIAERARAARASGLVEEAVARADRLLTAIEERLAIAGEGPPPPAGLAHLELARAEFERARGVPAPDRWSSAVAAWDVLAQPYPAAYARLRWAAALLGSGARRAEVAAVLDDAHAAAVELGAEVLRAEVEALGRRARLGPRADNAGEPRSAIPEPDQPWRGLGLTDRELDVLRLVMLGMTNPEIGERLFISPRTAGVHVSRILAKLDAPNRFMAAEQARKLGMAPSVLDDSAL